MSIFSKEEKWPEKLHEPLRAHLRAMEPLLGICKEQIITKGTRWRKDSSALKAMVALTALAGDNTLAECIPPDNQLETATDRTDS